MLQSIVAALLSPLGIYYVYWPKGTIQPFRGYQALKHLILCRVERRPPRLDLSIYPYLPKARVEMISAKTYMRLLSSDAGEAA